MKRPYRTLTFLICFLFVYLIATKVYDQYARTLALFSRLERENNEAMDPASLSARKARLESEFDSLSAMIMAARKGYQQNEIGVVQCLTQNARRAHVRIGSFTPGKEALQGQFAELPFTLVAEAQFKQVGVYVNKLENESIPFDITKLELVSNPAGVSDLEINLQGEAFLYRGFR